jgi:exopolysaccharide biosynthesis predicted pyruvyltransferase EpsI
MEIKDIRNFLKEYLNKEIIYIPNPGNAGDSLIAFGTILIFNELGLNWKMGNINEKYHNKTLFYAGGGNLVEIYSNCKNFIQKNINNNKIIILPHTIKSEDDLLSSLNDNIIIFCREKTTYKYVLDVFKHKKNVYLSKDMAFYINNLDKYKINGNGVCNSYRTDLEKTNIKIPKNNEDLSLKLNKTGNTNNIEVIKNVTLSMFDYLSKYETINTNRLHVAIAGTLLGKNVNFYRNNYYKNKSVFEYSIKDIYEKTIFYNE